MDPNRPAYGGTCYSAFQQGETVNVTQFDTASLTATATFYASTNTDHAYAHPIEGFKLDSVGSIPSTYHPIHPPTYLPTSKGRSTAVRELSH